MWVVASQAVTVFLIASVPRKWESGVVTTIKATGPLAAVQLILSLAKGEDDTSGIRMLPLQL